MTTAHGTADGSGRFDTLERHPFGVAGSAIVAMAAVTSVLAPDLVLGSEHERLPLPGLLVWLWAAVALSQVRTTFQGSLGRPEEHWLVATVSAVWAVAAALAVLGPVLVTGSDPTRIPLTSLVAPIAAAMVTASVCIAALVRRTASS